MINIYLNEKDYQIQQTQTLQDLLIENKQFGNHFAVSINNKLVPNQTYKETLFHPGDRVDIIIPMQGG